MVVVEATTVQRVVFGNRDHDAWFVLFSDGNWDYHGLPPRVVRKLEGRDAGSIRTVSLSTNDDRCYIAFTNGKHWSNDDTIKGILQNYKATDVNYVTFFDFSGYVVACSDGALYDGDLPYKLEKRLRRHGAPKILACGQIQTEILEPSRWFARWDSRYISTIENSELEDYLCEIDINCMVSFSFRDDYHAYWCQPTTGKFRHSIPRGQDGSSNELLRCLVRHKPGICKLNPQDINFTQESISHRFADGRHILDFVAELEKEESDSEDQFYDMKPMKVVWHKNKFWSLGNRRLWAYQKANEDSVEVEIVRRREIRITGDGKNVHVRGA